MISPSAASSRWRKGPVRPAQSLLAYLLLNAGTQHLREKLADSLFKAAAVPVGAR